MSFFRRVRCEILPGRALPTIGMAQYRLLAPAGRLGRRVMTVKKRCQSGLAFLRRGRHGTSRRIRYVLLTFALSRCILVKRKLLVEALAGGDAVGGREAGRVRIAAEPLAGPSDSLQDLCRAAIADRTGRSSSAMQHSDESQASGWPCTLRPKCHEVPSALQLMVTTLVEPHTSELNWQFFSGPVMAFG